MILTHSHDAGSCGDTAAMPHPAHHGQRLMRHVHLHERVVAWCRLSHGGGERHCMASHMATDANSFDECSTFR